MPRPSIPGACTRMSPATAVIQKTGLWGQKLGCGDPVSEFRATVLCPWQEGRPPPSVPARSTLGVDSGRRVGCGGGVVGGRGPARWGQMD